MYLVWLSLYIDVGYFPNLLAISFFTTGMHNNTLNSFIHFRQCFALLSVWQVWGKHCQVSFSSFLVVIYPWLLTQPVKFWSELQFYTGQKKKKICCVYKRNFFKALYNKQICFIFGSLEVQATNSYQCKYIFFLEITAPGNKTVIIFLYVGRILSSGKLRMNT